MVRIGMCTSCQHGDHEGHQRVVQAAPEGMMGGVVCGCKGECQGKPARHVQRQMDVIARAMRTRRDAIPSKQQDES